MGREQGVKGSAGNERTTYMDKRQGGNTRVPRSLQAKGRAVAPMPVLGAWCGGSLRAAVGLASPEAGPARCHALTLPCCHAMVHTPIMEPCCPSGTATMQLLDDEASPAHMPTTALTSKASKMRQGLLQSARTGRLRPPQVGGYWYAFGWGVG